MGQLNWLWSFNLPDENDTQTTVLDVVTGAGPTQFYLGYSFPADTSALTDTDAAAIAAAARSAAEAIDGVTSCTATPLSMSASGGSNYWACPTLLFNAAEWAAYQGIVTLPADDEAYGYPSGIVLYARSPADGILTSGDVAAVAAAVQASTEARPNVTSCTLSLTTYAPSTA